MMIITEGGGSVCWQLVAGTGRHPSCQAWKMKTHDHDADDDDDDFDEDSVYDDDFYDYEHIQMAQIFSTLSEKLFPQLIRISQSFKSLGAQIDNLP